MGGIDEKTTLTELKNESAYVRAWAIQLAAENKSVPPSVLAEMEKMAVDDPSAVVRLYLASAVQRLPIEQRWGVVKGLLGHAEDSSDHNLPLMVWYALEPLCAKDGVRALTMAATSKLPNVREFAARRIASGSKAN
jgi:hypothetical protein